MGEVYRAKDTRLDRLVALKVLPSHLSSDPDRRQRFDREARAISSLNHPHICTLHDVGHQDGIDFLVMELVEGESLADRLMKGALPLDQALQRAIEIADALSAAHKRGIVHRDLKPGNVMLTKAGAKLLDFGLARTAASDSSEAAPTVTRPAPLTQAGAIVGTLQYMAPEQLAGQDVDARSDIFAFGLLVCEMVTGKRMPVGAAAAAPTALPEPAAHVIVRCLARDPDDRWQSAGDVKRELEWARAAPPTPPQTRARGSNAWRWLISTGLVLMAVAGGWLWFQNRQTVRSPLRAIRLSINPPPGGEFRLAAGSSLSPDGRMVAFVAHTGSTDRLWVRPLDSAVGRELAGTDSATFPFWSPDSASIGFFASGKLKRVELAGGPPVAICDVTAGRGGTWNAEGTIVFNGYNDGPLLRVPASGGAPVPLTTIDKASGENSHRWPQFLPDGRTLLYYIRTADPQASGVYLVSLDHPDSKTRILGAAAMAWYARGADDRSGHLLWVRDDILMAQSFDIGRRALSDTPVAIAQGPFERVVGLYFFSASQEGTLIYEKAPGRNSKVTWYGRDGKPAGVVGAAESYEIPFTGPTVRISPDGTRIVVTRTEAVRKYDIWSIDLERGVTTRLTRNDANNAIWSPDGQRVAYLRNAPPNIFIRNVDGTGQEQRLTESGHSQQICDWSPDGRFILYSELPNELGAQTHSALWVVPVTGDRKPMPVLNAPFGETSGRFSPDGNWIAYTSDESGGKEIYVQRFPSDGAKWHVSAKGGDVAAWRKDGKELFYISPGGTLMSVDVIADGSALRFGTPAALFNVGTNYDVAPDGQRFVALTPADEREASPMTVIVNWPALLSK